MYFTVKHILYFIEGRLSFHTVYVPQSTYAFYKTSGKYPLCQQCHIAYVLELPQKTSTSVAGHDNGCAFQKDSWWTKTTGSKQLIIFGIDLNLVIQEITPA